MEFLWRCKTLIVPFVLIFIASTVLMFTEHDTAATIVSYPGAFLVVLGNLIYIVFFHSRGRWPDTTWGNRLRRVLTFKR